MGSTNTILRRGGAALLLATAATLFISPAVGASVRHDGNDGHDTQQSGQASQVPDNTVMAVRGNTHAFLSATSTGVTWSANTQRFYPNRTITYHWVLYRNGDEFYRNQHGGYRTDSQGTHWRLPSGFPQEIDCGAGFYEIRIWTTDASGNSTNAGTDTVTKLWPGAAPVLAPGPVPAA